MQHRPHGPKVVTLTPGCGYGDAGSEYIAGLSALGVPVTWTPMIANSAEVLGLAKRRRDLLGEAVRARHLQLGAHDLWFSRRGRDRGLQLRDGDRRLSGTNSPSAA